MTTKSGDSDSSVYWLNSGIPRHSADNKPIDGDADRIKVDYFLTDEKWFHRIGGAMSWGVPVEAEFVATKYRCYGAFPKADFFHYNEWTFVSERFKSVIDRFEPGVHQFFPVDVIGAGKAVIGRIYAFVPCVAIRCFSKLSMGFEPVGWEKNWGDHVWHQERSCRHPRLILDEQPTRGHHLWVAVDHWKRFVLVSDALKNALAEAKLANVVLTPMETQQHLRWALPEVVRSQFAIDPPWLDLLRME